MRDVKFRCWNKKLKVWGGDIAIRNNGVHTVSMLSDHVIARGDKYEVMQYTGLKDKNGVEIYEGDIVQYDNGLAEEVKFERRTVPNQNMISGQAPTHFEFWGLLWPSGFERGTVAGNIHENPDILQQRTIDKT